ncbi:hypothetical protein BT96DRAFT_578748 [Gymnopus androsaceus JB14]|uniref:Uncharacterized protein n=1 Tax=Gymnopus androsaceus JB14 TaxID=1447944 RepID=A0A6A4GIT7_9AGAR|nr:hypothetical protein BT96DRAFT_578748 [Gymnopus androsaceus JB14]
MHTICSCPEHPYFGFVALRHPSSDFRAFHKLCIYFRAQANITVLSCGTHCGNWTMDGWRRTRLSDLAVLLVTITATISLMSRVSLLDVHRLPLEDL